MLLEGRMTVLFRKGGINEKGFVEIGAFEPGAPVWPRDEIQRTAERVRAAVSPTPLRNL